jgi:hypothetical protein
LIWLDFKRLIKSRDLTMMSPLSPFGNTNHPEDHQKSKSSKIKSDKKQVVQVASDKLE